MAARRIPAAAAWPCDPRFAMGMDLSGRPRLTASNGAPADPVQSPPASASHRIPIRASASFFASVSHWDLRSRSRGWQKIHS
jgi:hypothetical protein